MDGDDAADVLMTILIMMIVETNTMLVWTVLHDAQSLEHTVLVAGGCLLKGPSRMCQHEACDSAYSCYCRHQHVPASSAPSLSLSLSAAPPPPTATTATTAATKPQYQQGISRSSYHLTSLRSVAQAGSGYLVFTSCWFLRGTDH